MKVFQFAVLAVCALSCKPISTPPLATEKLANGYTINIHENPDWECSIPLLVSLDKGKRHYGLSSTFMHIAPEDKSSLSKIVMFHHGKGICGLYEAGEPLYILALVSVRDEILIYPNWQDKTIAGKAKKLCKELGDELGKELKLKCPGDRGGVNYERTFGPVYYAGDLICTDAKDFKREMVFLFLMENGEHVQIILRYNVERKRKALHSLHHSRVKQRLDLAIGPKLSSLEEVRGVLEVLISANQTTAFENYERARNHYFKLLRDVAEKQLLDELVAGRISKKDYASKLRPKTKLLTDCKRIMEQTKSHCSARRMRDLTAEAIVLIRERWGQEM